MIKKIINPMGTRGKGKEILLVKIIKLEHNYCTNKDEDDPGTDNERTTKIISITNPKPKKYQRRSKPISNILKNKPRRKKNDSDSETEIASVLGTPLSNIDEAHIEKRRSGRTRKNKKYTDELELDLSDERDDDDEDDDDEKDSKSDKSKTNNQSVLDPPVESESQIVEKILSSRIGKRQVPKNEEDESLLDVESNDSTKRNESIEMIDIEVEEFYVKYKNFSYLHCEWKTLNELELSDKRISQKIRRYKIKESQRPVLKLDDDDLFNPEYVEVERILDEAVTTEENGETVIHYLVKWRGLSYEDSTWELSENVEDDKIECYKILSEIPPDIDLVPIERPRPEDWSQLDSSPIYKDGNELRDYQVEGVSWLLYCYYNEQNCILADEMGLGKTVQSIAFIQEVYNYGIRGPFLIIVPLSTIGNWSREFESWTDLNAIVYHGTQSSRNIIQDYELFFKDPITKNKLMDGYKFNVMITTYEVILQDVDLLSQFDWRLAIIDEAHRLKNKNCKLSEGLKLFDVEHKVLLTGTPLQNNVEELFSLLNFLEPQRFHNVHTFLSDFGDLKTESQVTKLKALLKPMMLRRLKEDVEKSLSAKSETVIEVELTNIQKKYYRAILERNFTFLSKGSTSTANVPNLMNTMMELRKCCNHPFLITGAEEQIVSEWRSTKHTNNTFQALVQASGKMVLIDKLFPKLKAGNHKILVFSQMIRVLDILEDYLIHNNYLYERLDGRIRGNLRQEAIDRFSKPDSDRFVFLLCTRAGGLGINLTAADTVIIFDSDWNPQNDLQAQARCHRIGQDKMVKVYRLVTRNSYEREMFDRASIKLGLDKAVLQSMKENVKEQNALSKKEIEDLLKKGAYGAIMDDDTAADQFCEEDIDQILQRRTQVIKIEGGEKNSTFAKASFSATGNRNDIDIDDPNFWQKWAKKAELNIDDLNGKNDLIIEQPRNRKQTSRYGNDDGNESASESVSTEESELDDGAIEINFRGKKGRKAARAAATRRAKKKAEEHDRAYSGDESSRGYYRNECFKVEKYLLIYGWGRWSEMLQHCRFKRRLNARDCERIAAGILNYSLGHYHGDDKIKVFIADLIQGKAQKKGHSGLSAPVPRGRKGKKRSETEEIDVSGLEDPVKILVDEGYRKHLHRHANKVLLRVRLLFYIKQELIGEEVKKVFNNYDISKINIPQPCSDGDKPAFWWDEEADKSLIIGVFKHGYERYNQIRQDNVLCFFQKCGPPDSKALAAELKQDEEEDVEEDDDNDDNEISTKSTSDAKTATEADENGFLPFPSASELNTRLRRIITSYQRDYKRVQEKLQKSAKKIEKRERLEAVIKQRERDKLDAKQKWTRREESDFYRIISSFGLETNEDGSYNWENFRQLARLEKKYDDTLTEYLKSFMAMVRIMAGRSCQPSDADLLKNSELEPISEERASRTLLRVELLEKIRQEVLNHPHLEERLNLCQHSNEMPTWFQPGQHDLDLLRGAAKHGLSRTENSIVFDEDLSFHELINGILSERKENIARIMKEDNDKIMENGKSTDDDEDNNDDEEEKKDTIIRATALDPLQTSNELWPKDRAILNRLIDVCDCVMNNEWPTSRKVGPFMQYNPSDSRCSSPSSSNADELAFYTKVKSRDLCVQMAEDDSLKLTIHKRQMGNDSLRFEDMNYEESDNTSVDVSNGNLTPVSSTRLRKRTFADSNEFYVDPEARVTVINIEDGTKLSGDEAPRQFELDEWLSENPQYAVAQIMETMSKRSRKPRFDPIKADMKSLTGNENVVVINRETGRRITGAKAPVLRQLTIWLEQNPAFDVDLKWRSILSMPEWKLPKHLEKRFPTKTTTSDSKLSSPTVTPRLYSSGLTKYPVSALNSTSSSTSSSPIIYNPLLSGGTVQYSSTTPVKISSISDRIKRTDRIKKIKS